MTASLDELRAHLDSPDPAVRGAALAHVTARGAEARGLAVRVARCLTDPDVSVQYAAMGAFRAVGSGAADAVSVLLDDIDAASPGEMLRTRAIYCLGVVGPAAREAAPRLLALEGADRGRALEALCRIVDRPDAAVAEAVLAGCLDDDYAIWSGTARALPHAPAWLASWVLAGAAKELASARGRMAANVVLELTPRWPDEALPLAHRAIREQLPGAALLGLALERSHSPVPLDIAQALLRQGIDGVDGAFRVLAACASRTDRAALVSEARERLAPALAEGELRWVASGASALAAIAPGSGIALDVVLERAARALRARQPAVYPTGTLLEAAAALADEARLPRTVEALKAAKKRSAAIVRKDRSGGLDLQRAIARAFGHLAERSREAASAAATPTEASRVDAMHARADAARAAAKPPPIPKPRMKAKPARASALRAADRTLLEALRAEARKLGLRAKTPTKVIAWADAEVSRRQVEGGHDAAPDVAAVYGDAVAQMLGWKWMRFEQGSLVQLAVVSPKKRHALLPGKLVTRGLAPGADVALALTANMLRERAPASKPGALVVLR